MTARHADLVHEVNNTETLAAEAESGLHIASLYANIDELTHSMAKLTPTSAAKDEQYEKQLAAVVERHEAATARQADPVHEVNSIKTLVAANIMRFTEQLAAAAASRDVDSRLHVSSLHATVDDQRRTMHRQETSRAEALERSSTRTRTHCNAMQCNGGVPSIAKELLL